MGVAGAPVGVYGMISALGAGLPRDGRPGTPTLAETNVVLLRAAALALLATLPLSFLFAARSAVIVFPLLTLILWRGIGTRPLTAAAAALLRVGEPALYAVIGPKDRGGYDSEYSSELIWAHWVGAAALVLLFVACGRAVAEARRRPAPPPASDQPPDPGAEPAPGHRELAGAGRAGR